MKRALNFMNKIPPVSVWDGLVSLYKLDETSGTTANDSFGVQHLTNTGGVTINESGKLGQAYSVTSGSSKYLAKTSVPVIGTTFSINLWAYRTGDGNGDFNNMAEQGTFGNGFGIWYRKTGSYISAWINGNYNVFNATATPLPLNTWTMITVTYDNSNIKLYVNGIFIQATAYSLANTANTRRLFTRTDYTSEQYWGRLDNVSFFNKALTDSQITAHYNGGAGITL